MNNPYRTTLEQLIPVSHQYLVYKQEENPRFEFDNDPELLTFAQACGWLSRTSVKMEVNDFVRFDEDVELQDANLDRHFERIASGAYLLAQLASLPDMIDADCLHGNFPPVTEPAHVLRARFSLFKLLPSSLGLPPGVPPIALARHHLYSPVPLPGLKAHWFPERLPQFAFTGEFTFRVPASFITDGGWGKRKYRRGRTPPLPLLRLSSPPADNLDQN